MVGGDEVAETLWYFLLVLFVLVLLFWWSVCGHFRCVRMGCDTSVRNILGLTGIARVAQWMLGIMVKVVTQGDSFSIELGGTNTWC